ncbi:MAG: hypothetical protein H7Y11_00440 [Armatimonadetes bacterium]|nr:hypothetical protein [Anaerolineae bacterium]
MTDPVEQPLLTVQPTTQLEVEPSSTSSPAEAPTLMGGLRRWLFPTYDERTAQYEARLAVLNAAIDQHASAPSGYVLRGELHAQYGMDRLAAADFQQGLALAQQAMQVETWGVVSQAMLERAQAGLKRVMRSV